MDFQKYSFHLAIFSSSIDRNLFWDFFQFISFVRLWYHILCSVSLRTNFLRFDFIFIKMMKTNTFKIQSTTFAFIPEHVCLLLVFSSLLRYALMFIWKKVVKKLLFQHFFSHVSSVCPNLLELECSHAESQTTNRSPTHLLFLSPLCYVMSTVKFTVNQIRKMIQKLDTNNLYRKFKKNPGL